MPNLVIQNMSGLNLKVTNNSQSILENVQENYIDWMHACGGKGRCTTCRAEIVSGMEQLSPLNEAEQRMSARINSNERLCCQAKIIGNQDVVIRVPKGSQFPHINYAEG